MQEFEPKRKNKIITKEFLAKNAYVLVLAVLLLGGITYGYTFFIQNKKIASGSITTANLTINFTDRSINASSFQYTKNLTITNTTATDGIVKLSLTRTSGLELTDMQYMIIANGAFQQVGDVPASGEIYTTAIMGGSPIGEVINVEVGIWPKSSYTGSETTFVGEIIPEIKYLGPTAAKSINSPAGKYVNFNCSSTCEVWQIVKVEDERLVLTRQADYEGATSRTNSNRYRPDSFNPVLTFDDDSMITSLSTDGKNVYLAKTVKLDGGSGTQADPYNLRITESREADRKVTAVITYKDTDNTTLGTQNVYYDGINHIMRKYNDPGFQYWSDGTNHYVLWDTVSFTSDTTLTAVVKQVTTMSLSSNSGTISVGNSDTITITTDGDGLLSCASSNDSYATCSINGTTLTITGVAEGSATITVSQAEGTTHLAATDTTYTATIEPSLVTINFNANGGTVSPASKDILSTSTTYGNLTYLITPPSGYYFDAWYTEAEGGTKVTSVTSFTDGISPTTLYAHWTTTPLCRRVTEVSQLHTETCGYTNSQGCGLDGYTSGGSKKTTTITYGSIWDGTSSLKAGDAFDCDVNGNGVIDTDNGISTERFYYVSDYYNTYTKTFDNTTAVLIYYRNYIDGLPDDSYASVMSNNNSSGPTVATSHLPVVGDGTNNSWRDDLLKISNTTNITKYRKIYSCDTGSCPTVYTKTSAGNLPTAFEYKNSTNNLPNAARLVTAMEVNNGCSPSNIAVFQDGGLSNCNFLLERTRYKDATTYPSYGIWFENAYKSNNTDFWEASFIHNSVGHGTGYNINPRGIRPTIDVPLSQIG